MLLLLLAAWRSCLLRLKAPQDPRTREQTAHFRTFLHIEGGLLPDDVGQSHARVLNYGIQLMQADSFRSLLLDAWSSAEVQILASCD